MSKFSREDYTKFLQYEYNTLKGDYYRVVNTPAIALKEQGKVFCCQLVSIDDKRRNVVLKVRAAGCVPQKGKFFSAVLFDGEWGKFKQWGSHMPWKELVAEHAIHSCECLCVYVTPSREDGFLLVGINGVEVDFVKRLKRDDGSPIAGAIVCLGPQMPPVGYILHLQHFVPRSCITAANALLDYDESPVDCWSPRLVGSSESLSHLVAEAFGGGVSCVVVQGPPGTGKTYRMALLAAQYLSMGLSVLVTSLTNRALMEVAHKLKELAADGKCDDFLGQGRVCKTSLTEDEADEMPELIPLSGNVCQPLAGHLALASFYVASGWTCDAETCRFALAIVDEASQAYLPMLAVSAALGEKCVWVGDQNQLAPIAQMNGDLVHKNSWMPLVQGFSTVCRHFNFPQFMLTDTFRLTARGAEFTSLFYSHRLSSVAPSQAMPFRSDVFHEGGGPSLLRLSLPLGNKCPECAFARIAEVVADIHDKSPDASVAVLAKFVDTIAALQKHFLNIRGPRKSDKVLISTVDSVQGMTVDFCVLLIPNVSSRYSLEPELFNVATSRARLATLIIADDDVLMQDMDERVRRFFLKLCNPGFVELKPVDASPQSGGSLKLIGKIDLDKVDPHRRRPVTLPQGPKMFVIDTNVFVDCPDILSRIKAPDSAVVPTTVLEELDKLKINKRVDKAKLTNAIKNINASFSSRRIQLAETDVSALPDGFDAKNPDTLILSSALKLKADGQTPVLLTSDAMLQSKAIALSVAAVSLRDFNRC